MENGDVENTRVESLAEIMDLGAGDELWKPEELAAILRHQLSAPVEFDLSFLDIGPARTLDTLHSLQGPPIASFRDLLHHPCPPIELLELTKEFSKVYGNRPEAPLPEQIAALLYVLSIVVALTRCRRRITKLDDQGLRRRLEWALAQFWVDDPTRELLREGYQAIQVKGAGPHA